MRSSHQVPEPLQLDFKCIEVCEQVSVLRSKKEFLNAHRLPWAVSRASFKPWISLSLSLCLLSHTLMVQPMTAAWIWCAVVIFCSNVMGALCLSLPTLRVTQNGIKVQSLNPQSSGTYSNSYWEENKSNVMI